MVSNDDVVMAYRLFLDREPENPATVAAYAKSTRDIRTLRDQFLNSAEFDSARVPHLPAVLDEGRPLRIDVDVSVAALQGMLSRVEDTWHRLGCVEPFWSVLSSEEFRQDKFGGNAEAFYLSGEKEARRLNAWLKRNCPTFDTRSRSCCEYGCGTGRVTKWLASQFLQVTACDISKPHLDLADAYLRRIGVTNVLLRQIDSMDSLSQIEPVDLVFSCIVLQHNPPPIMALILKNMLRWLKPGGIAFFQLPTYCLNYEFIASDYLLAPSTREIEMHVLPQRYVCDIARQQKCVVLEIQPDGFVGLPYWISTSFLLQKQTSE
jgi:2-polyprenyl-3-methyl-5-hydroxy-6-metoxy-1,4-benzoquinol methylase